MTNLGENYRKYYFKSAFNNFYQKLTLRLCDAKIFNNQLLLYSVLVLMEFKY